MQRHESSKVLFRDTNVTIHKIHTGICHVYIYTVDHVLYVYIKPRLGTCVNMSIHPTHINIYNIAI